MSDKHPKGKVERHDDVEVAQRKIGGKTVRIERENGQIHLSMVDQQGQLLFKQDIGGNYVTMQSAEPASSPSNKAGLVPAVHAVYAPEVSSLMNQALDNAFGDDVLSKREARAFAKAALKIELAAETPNSQKGSPIDALETQQIAQPLKRIRPASNQR